MPHSTSHRTAHARKALVRHRLAAGVLLIAGLLLRGAAAWANDFVVYSPHVTQGQSELEFRGYAYHDGNVALNNQRGYEVSVAHAFTGWWRPEFYVADYTRTPDGVTASQGYEFENTFQLAPTGEYWADLGLLASYEYHTQAGVPDAVEFGPLLEKQTGRILQRLNLIWEKEVGSGASSVYEFRTAYSLRYLWRPALAPGVEAYLRPNDHAYHLGPVLYGELPFARRGSELEYSAGVVFGLNRDAADQTFVLRLEYEFF